MKRTMSYCLMISTLILSTGCMSIDPEKQECNCFKESSYFQKKYVFPGTQSDPIKTGLFATDDIRCGVLYDSQGELVTINKQKTIEILRLVAKPTLLKRSEDPVEAIGVAGPHFLDPIASFYIHRIKGLDVAFDICDREFIIYQGCYFKIPESNGKTILDLLELESVPEDSFE